MAKIGIYCGSFDPVHIGHERIVKESLKQYLDKVIMVPTKDYWDKKMNYSIDERIMMILSLGIDNLICKKEYTVFDYTYELFDYIKKEYPEDELYLILGADNLLKFDKWMKYEYLLTYPFIIMKRDEVDIDIEMRRLNKTNYFILDSEKIDVSSSEIRGTKDKEKIKGMVPKEVIDKIW